MQHIQAITLDAAGTLFGVAEPVGDTYARYAERFEIPVSAAELERGFRTLFPRMAPLAFGSADVAARERQERAWWRTLVRNCLGRHGQHPRFNAYFDAVYAHYADRAAWRLFPDVVPALDALSAAGYRLGVVSNFDTRLPILLDGFELTPRFDCVVHSSAAGSAKPDRRIFARACEQLGHPPAATLHVGDDRRADRDGARAAGLGALWLRRRHEPSIDEAVIGDLGQILDRLSGDTDGSCRSS